MAYDLATSIVAKEVEENQQRAAEVVRLRAVVSLKLCVSTGAGFVVCGDPSGAVVSCAPFGPWRSSGVEACRTDREGCALVGGEVSWLAAVPDGQRRATVGAGTARCHLDEPE